METEQNHEPCWACPHEDEVNQRPPVPPNGMNTFCTLHCGHRIHTHCAFHFWMQRENLQDLACVECNTLVLTQQQTDFYNEQDDNTYQQARQKECIRIAELWLTDPGFRHKVTEFSKAFNTFYTVRNKYMKDKNKLKSDFKKKIYIAKQTILMERKAINKKLIRLETRKAALREMKKVKTYWSELEEKYNLTEEPLLHRTLDRMDDAPKFKGRGPGWRFYWTYRIRDKIY